MYSAFIVFLCVTSSGGQTPPRVETKLGAITGLARQVGNSNILEFRGIPYAKPPVGKYRFRKTELYGPWNGTLDAVQFGPACIQVLDNNHELQNKVISEDCLTLNIYVPGNVSGEPRSTMVWIHGGGFFINQGAMYDGTYIALYGDVTVVTVNYRLGVLGFLSTGTHDLPGNPGLWDQHLAIRWVKENIGSFGGDPNSITLFGASAGGASVSLHALLPQNKNMFHRVIAQSGLANSYLTFVYDPLYYARLLGARLGCRLDESVPDWLTFCISKASADELLTAQESMPWHREDRARSELMFGAVVDGDLISDFPMEMIKDNNSESGELFNSIDFLVGGTDMEGSMFYDIFSGILSDRYNLNPMDGFPTDVVCGYLIAGLITDIFPTCRNKKEIKEAICTRYRGSDPASHARNMLDLYNDVFFVLPVIEFLDRHSDADKGTTYQYMFTRRGTSTNPATPKWFNGTPHGAELPYLFGRYQASENNHSTADDLKLSTILIKLWTNFAKTGNPNTGDLPYWREYTHRDRFYYNISTTPSAVIDVFKDRISLWQTDIPELVSSSCIRDEL